MCVLMMMMIAFITIKSSLVPLIEGLCAQIYFRFEISVVCSHLLLFLYVCVCVPETLPSQHSKCYCIVGTFRKRHRTHTLPMWCTNTQNPTLSLSRTHANSHYSHAILYASYAERGIVRTQFQCDARTHKIQLSLSRTRANSRYSHTII